MGVEKRASAFAKGNGRFFPGTASSEISERS